MKKNAGLTYVSDFTFSPEQGFTGSAGKSTVKGYMRGGAVKKDPVKAAAKKPRAYGPGAAKGGYMKGGEYKHVGGPNPEKEYPKSQARQQMPKNVKARGGKANYAYGGEVGVTTENSPDMKGKAKQAHYAKKSAAKARGGKAKSMHDKLYAEGGKMGYAYGGQVKDTSGEFLMESKPQESMDHGTQPKRRGRTQAGVEAGGTPKLKPKLAKGGTPDKSMVDKTKKTIQKKKMKGMSALDMAKRYSGGKKSRKGMPKNVKAKGGLMQYAEGGDVTVKAAKRATPAQPRAATHDKPPMQGRKHYAKGGYNSAPLIKKR